MNTNRRDRSTRRINRFFALIVLAAIGFAVFLPGMSIKYYDDDFQFVYPTPSRAAFYYFSHDNPANNFYRPLQAMFLAGVQYASGLNTMPIHATNIILHILLAWLVLLVMTRLRFSLVQSFAGALFMLVSQANVHAVLSNDTFSQVASTLTGTLAMYALFKVLVRLFSDRAGAEERAALYKGAAGKDGGKSGKRSTYGTYTVSIILFALSLLFKETAVSFLLIAAVMLFSARWILRAYSSTESSTLYPFNISMRDSSTNRFAFTYYKAAVLLLPFIIVTALYLVVRSHIVTARAVLGPNPYNFHIGLNIVKNLGLLFAAASSPVSTVTLYTAAKTAHLTGFSIYITVAAIFVIPTICGLIRLRKNVAIQLSLVFSVLALFPAFFLNHVSELYIYNAMPFIAFLVGAGFGHFAERSDLKLERVIAIVVAVVVGATNIGAVASKASLMWENGEKAQVIMEQVEQTITSHPRCSCLYLVNPRCSKVEYSIFTYNGFHVIKNSLNYIKKRTVRNDLDIKIITSKEYSHLDKSLLEHCAFLTMSSCRGSRVKTLSSRVIKAKSISLSRQ